MANEINEKEELEAIIQTIDMTPEQQVAFDKYIGEFLTEYKTNMQKKIVEEVTDTLTREYNEKAKLFEERLRKSLEEDVSVEVSEKLKTEFDEKLKVELDKQLKEAVDVLNDYYLSRYELFCQETAGEIESEITGNTSAMARSWADRRTDDRDCFFRTRPDCQMARASLRSGD